MGEARTWLESRHLGRSPEGAYALACFSRLPQDTADAILRDADQLACVSVTLAHRFFVGAVALQTENPDRYPESITADEFLQQRLREIKLA